RPAGRCCAPLPADRENGAAVPLHRRDSAPASPPVALATVRSASPGAPPSPGGMSDSPTVGQSAPPCSPPGGGHADGRIEAVPSRIVPERPDAPPPATSAVRI